MSAREQELPGPMDRELLEELYERARAMSPEARAAFLAEACRSDRTLEAELRSLLAHAEPAEAFFESLAGAAASPAVGHRVGHYRILGTLGSGGMGTVYRAHDSRLDREVALKFLPPYLSAQPEARERLLMEARAAAALEHPNVCTIHEIGETADGRPFIAMACYAGETLKERLARGPVPPSEAVVIAAQIAGGLAAAHARGIVHRDVKPGNVMLCTDGTVRLLDFGLAKLQDVTLTGPGVTPGTVAYMSPEQARGDRLDHRTDLWSLGVVLYEMLSGERPFRGGNDRALVQSILHEGPPPITQRGPRIPEHVAKVVERLLSKEPDGRPHGAEQLLQALTPAPADRRRGLRRTALAAAGVLAVAALGVVALVYARRTASDRLLPVPDPTPAAPSIAVLPFSVHGQDLEVWREGLVDLLSAGLDGAGGLRTIDARTLLARWRAEIGDTAAPNLAFALAVARRAGAGYALLGTVVAAGERARLVAEIYDVPSGRSVGHAQVEGSRDSVLPLADQLGIQALEFVLDRDPRDLPVVNLAGATTSSLRALRAYLDGEARFRRSDFLGAAEAWERALAADTLFALAASRLVDAYGWDEAGPSFARYEAHLRRAYRLANRLPRREARLVEARWARRTGSEGVALVEEVVREYPDNADAWYELGELYYHHPGLMRKPAEIERAFRQAADLQPSSAPYRAHLLDLAFAWRPDSSRIARELEAYRRLAPTSQRTKAASVAFELAFGSRTGRLSTAVVCDSLSPGTAAQVYLFLGHPSLIAARADLLAGKGSCDLDSSPQFAWLRFFHLAMGEGRLGRALALLDSPWIGKTVPLCGPRHLSRLGFPIREEMVSRAAARGRKADWPPDNSNRLTCAAAEAARQGRSGEHGALVSLARTRAGQALASGDTALARNWEGTPGLVDAQELWRKGKRAEALRTYESLLPRYTERDWLVRYIAQLSFELGHLAEAERAFGRLWNDPLAYLYLGRIYERTGRPAQAIEAYDLFASAWRDADPELQSLVEEAREAVLRLSNGDPGQSLE